MYKIEELFDLKHTMAKEYLERVDYPWEALAGIGDLVIELGKNLDKSQYTQIKTNVWIHNTASVYGSASISGPTIIGPKSEIKHCAFIRGSVLIGENCVIGNSCEIKNAIIFDGTQIPHFNYVGDSIMGYKSHLGAGAITSNFKSDKRNIVVHDEEEDYETGIRKFGAMVGDYVEVGCNSVLNPGTIVGKNSVIYPLSSVRGIIPANSIYKDGNNIVTKIEAI